MAKPPPLFKKKTSVRITDLFHEELKKIETTNATFGKHHTDRDDEHEARWRALMRYFDEVDHEEQLASIGLGTKIF